MINFKQGTGITEMNKINQQPTSKSKEKMESSQTHRTASNTRYREGLNALDSSDPSVATASMRPTNTRQHMTHRNNSNEEKPLIHFRVKHAKDK